MQNERMRYRANPNTATQEAEGEVFIVTPDNRFHNLRDPVASFLWNRLETESLTLDELVEEVVGEFEVEADLARRDVAEFLQVGCDRDIFLVDAVG